MRFVYFKGLRTENRKGNFVHKVERSEQIVVLAAGLQVLKKTKTKKKQKPEILLLFAATSTCWFSHSGPSLLLMLHTVEIHTPTLKSTETDRVLQLTSYCSFSNTVIETFHFRHLLMLLISIFNYFPYYSIYIKKLVTMI